MSASQWVMNKQHSAEAVVTLAVWTLDTYFLTFFTFMLAVLLQERMRGSELSSGISALRAWKIDTHASFQCMIGTWQFMPLDTIQ